MRARKVKTSKEKGANLPLSSPLSTTTSSSSGERGLTLVVSPQGHLLLEEGGEFTIAEDVAQRITLAFAGGYQAGILHLATVELISDVGPLLSFWRQLGQRLLSKVCAIANLEQNRQNFDIPTPTPELEALLVSAPPMRGGEYLTISLMETLWVELKRHVEARLLAYKGRVDDFFHGLNPAWNLVGRVCFHLVENKNDSRRPFAFLATYTNRLSAQAKAQHLPLERALTEFSGAGRKHDLLALLRPIQKAAELSSFLKKMVDLGEIFHPLAWTAEEAYRFLQEIPAYESAGVVVRVPDWWRAQKPLRPMVEVRIGEKKPAGLGLTAMLDFKLELSLGGERLSQAEWQDLMDQTPSLVPIRGQWVELDRAKLDQVLTHWRHVQSRVDREGMTFADGMRLLAGASRLGPHSRGGKGLTAGLEGGHAGWSNVAAGGWLQKTLAELKYPESRKDLGTIHGLNATLRPYQKTGVEWLWLLHRLGLGACLADDMGLGKTIQLLSLLLLAKKRAKISALLVVPASLISNWTSEIDRFAPSLDVFVLHPSALPEGLSEKKTATQSAAADLTVTTYGFLTRAAWLQKKTWDIVILDEAQAIKNPGSQQTLAAKALKSRQRIALTGTPVENRLSDLWSIFDFTSPGLLGSAKEFSQFIKERQDPYPAIRSLIRPYILRRLKTDKTIIADLPPKTEMKVFCSLKKEQAVHYKKAVMELAARLEEVDGIKRRGVVLSYLMRLKQICNHPSHWLGDGGFAPELSGKFARLQAICEEIAARQEKVLVFTQFREITGPLSRYLAEIFGHMGLVLHGGTPVKDRKQLVEAFQKEDGPPYFVLSLKAGGTGLNLTAASHVIHFDRWWNPAVENQATDRAFRIGQRRHVVVHKFVCRGTMEEKVDTLIEEKKKLAAGVLEGGGELVLTEMSDHDLIQLVSLDLKRAVDEGA